eukprot:546981-Prorocentrum_minimum.AAC.1
MRINDHIGSSKKGERLLWRCNRRLVFSYTRRDCFRGYRTSGDSGDLKETSKLVSLIQKQRSGSKLSCNRPKFPA